MTLTWLDIAAGYRLESAPNLSTPILWSSEAGSFQTNAGAVSIAFPISGTKKIYRLTKP